MWNKKYRNRFVPMGRIGRKDFFKSALFINISNAILLYLWRLSTSFLAPESSLYPLVWLYVVILTWTLLCLITKRMHDLGLRMWWFWLFFISYGWTMWGLFPNLSPAWISHIFLIIVGSVLIFKKGQAGKNKFGSEVV